MFRINTSAETERKFTDDYQHTMIQRHSQKLFGRFLYDILCGRWANSTIFYLQAALENIEISLQEKEVSAFKFWVPQTEVVGPIPLVGESSLRLNTQARLFCWNPLANKSEEIIEALTISTHLIRTLPSVEKLHIPTLDLILNISPFHLLITAAPLHSITRIIRNSRSIQFTLDSALKPLKDEVHMNLLLQNRFPDSYRQQMWCSDWDDNS